MPLLIFTIHGRKVKVCLLLKSQNLDIRGIIRTSEQILFQFGVDCRFDKKYIKTYPSETRRGKPRSIRFLPPPLQTVSQLAERQMLLFCHSGLDPESISVSGAYVSGCRIRSGMTGANQAFF
jgi:hypothetical protein